MKNLKEEIQELKERLAILEGMVDRVQEQQINKDYGKFVPENQQLHYWINHHGEIEKSRSTDYNVYYNAFPTLESAEAEANYTLISRQYRNFARKLNNGKPFDWDDENQDKFGVVFGWNDYGDAEKAVLYVDRWTTTNALILQLAFHEKEHAELALKVFGDDLLILANP